MKISIFPQKAIWSHEKGETTQYRVCFSLMFERSFTEQPVQSGSNYRKLENKNVGSGKGELTPQAGNPNECCGRNPRKLGSLFLSTTREGCEVPLKNLETTVTSQREECETFLIKINRYIEESLHARKTFAKSFVAVLSRGSENKNKEFSSGQL